MKFNLVDNPNPANSVPLAYAENARTLRIASPDRLNAVVLTEQGLAYGVPYTEHESVWVDSGGTELMGATLSIKFPEA